MDHRENILPQELLQRLPRDIALPTRDELRVDKALRPFEYVYFLRMIEEPLLKIGWTRHVENRMRTLQTLTPQPLRLLGLLVCPRRVGRAIEHHLHQSWKACRFLGEWFRMDEGTLELFEDMGSGSDPGFAQPYGFPPQSYLGRVERHRWRLIESMLRAAGV